MGRDEMWRGLREAVRHYDWPSIRLLSVGAAVATPVGAYGLARLPAAPVRLAIALVVTVGGICSVGGRGSGIGQQRMRPEPSFSRAFSCRDPFGAVQPIIP